MAATTNDSPPELGGRSWIGMGLTLLIPLLGLVAVIVYELQTPPPWRQLLDAYQTQAAAAGESWSVQAVHSAPAPQNLTDSLPFAPVAETPFYHLQPEDAQAIAGSDSRRPLPYPPSQIECVYLLRRNGEERVLVLAHHADLYNAAWVAHEPRASGTALAHALEQIGCPAPEKTR